MVIGEPVTGAAATTGATTGADAAATVFFPVDFGAGAGAARRPSAIAVDSSTVAFRSRVALMASLV